MQTREWIRENGPFFSGRRNRGHRCRNQQDCQSQGYQAASAGLPCRVRQVRRGQVQEVRGENIEGMFSNEDMQVVNHRLTDLSAEHN